MQTEQKNFTQKTHIHTQTTKDEYEIMANYDDYYDDDFDEDDEANNDDD